MIQSEAFTQKKNQTHQEMKTLIKCSEERIQKSISSVSKFNEESMIEKVEQAFNGIIYFVSRWEKVFVRSDQIALAKDFYRQIAKKSLFDPFWLNEKKLKQPQSGNIKSFFINEKISG